MSVDDQGDRIVIDVALLAGDALGDHDALFHALVGEHRAGHDVADGPDLVEVGPAMFIDGDEAARVDGQADVVGAQAVGIRHAPDPDDQPVALEATRFVAGLVIDLDALLALADLVDFRAELDGQALLLGEHLPGLLGHGRIGGAEKVGQRFEDRHLGAEALPHRAEFEADDAGADHAEALGHVLEGQGTGVVADHLVVDGNAGQVPRLRTGGDDDVAGLDRLAALGAAHGDLPEVVLAAGELAVAGEQRHLVLLEQAADAAGQLGDDVVLAPHHRRHVHLHAFGGNAVHDERMTGLIEQFRRLQQRLRGNAADIETGAAEAHFALGVGIGFGFDAGGVETQLGGADRRDIAAGAAADDDDIKLFGHYFSR